MSPFHLVLLLAVGGVPVCFVDRQEGMGSHFVLLMLGKKVLILFITHTFTFSFCSLLLHNIVP